MQTYAKARLAKAYAGLERIVGVGLLLGLVGCSTPKFRNEPPTHSPGHAGDANPASLELNEGKKWVVAKPMMAHVRSLEKAVLQFERTPGGDHSRLASQIQEDLGRLVTNCTMEGKAHDELRKWLLPFLALTADYAKESDPQIQQLKFSEIRQSLLVFNEYFE